MAAAQLTDWIGRTETISDQVTPTPASALAAMLNRDSKCQGTGTALPALWHWLYFLPLAQQASLGSAGPPSGGGVMPPGLQPRRMWAGSQFQFNEALQVGDQIERRATIESISEKTGRSGALVFVKVRHDVFRARSSEQPAFVEHHDIVYRDAPDPDAPPPKPVAAPTDFDWERRIDPDPVLLFRFSALTFNGHRIHYDREYAREVEGYPGLVVHGPLIAMLLLDALRHELKDPALASYEFRAQRPVFEPGHFYVCGKREPDGKTVRLWAKDQDGWLAMQATAVLA